MRRYYLFIFSLMCLLVVSCQKDDAMTTETSQTTNNNDNESSNSATIIDEAFRPYVQKFIAEMQQRGKDYSQIPIRVTFVDELTASNSSQFCAYGYPDFPGSIGATVEVLETSNCWFDRNDTERENLIFHELGHAFMVKTHTEGVFPNGSPISLMCGTTCNTYRVYNKYQTQQRSFYLDELANTGIPTPNWASKKTFSKTIAIDEIEKATTNWQYEIFSDNNNETPYSFFIEETNTTSAPYSLGINASLTTNNEVAGYWYRYFEIENYNYCSNVEVTATIITEDLTEGFAAIIVDLIEINPEGALTDFGRYFTLTTENQSGFVQYDDFKTTAICLTPETKYIKVLCYLNCQKVASAFFDDIKLDLYQ